jgi:polyisoprenoid-binding protein YceI
MRRYLGVISCLLFLSLSLFADNWQGKADIKFSGKSTLHDFEGHGSGNVLAQHDAEWHLQGKVPVADLGTDNSSRDKNMLEMFHSKKFPEISIKVVSASPDKKKVELEVQISGKTLKVPGEVVSWNNQDRQQSIVIHFKVSLGAFGLERPSAMFGMIKVKDEIDVDVKMELEPSLG